MIEIRIERRAVWDGHGFDVLMCDPQKRLIVTDLVLKEAAEAQIIPPVTRITPIGAQILMDQLWDCGIRPTEGTGSAGSLAATQKHLSDMRAIAFKQLKMENPK